VAFVLDGMAMNFVVDGMTLNVLVLLKIYFSKFSMAMTFVADGMFYVIL
jgi:hypothetical protein